MQSMCKHNILINGWMELISTALIKTITLHWERCSSSGGKQLETQPKSSKYKMHQLLLPDFPVLYSSTAP